jgi:hypothetical protein
MTRTHHCWIVAGMPAEQKQLIHASQIAVRKTLFAPESPLSFCSLTDWERKGEWDCACAQNLNTCSFIPYGKLTSVCILKVVMADWNRSNHFDTPCIDWVMLVYVCKWNYTDLRGKKYLLYNKMKIQNLFKMQHGFLVVFVTTQVFCSTTLDAMHRHSVLCYSFYSRQFPLRILHAQDGNITCTVLIELMWSVFSMFLDKKGTVSCLFIFPSLFVIW